MGRAARTGLGLWVPSALVVGALGLALYSGAAFADASPPSLVALPGPAPRARDAGYDPRAANEACASCHQEIAAEWRGSMHQEAWIDPVFQEAYQIEQQAFCRGCHAPEADSEQDPGAGAAAVGVGCTTCHVQDNRIVGAAPASDEAPHPVFADARMATQAACASCHQFDFPGLGLPMQDTLSEHARSSFADVACQACHMPPVNGPGERRHRSHAFAVFADPAMIRSAARVQAERSDAASIEVEITSAIVGHAFPTGDMFRRLEVRAHAVDAAGDVIATADPVFLGRVFGDRPAHGAALGAGLGSSPSFRRTEISDTRVPPPGDGGPRRVALRFDRPVGEASIVWGVYYQRMTTAMAASFGIDQAHDEVAVHEGVLEPVASSALAHGGSR
jgi:hypothetical protein